MIQGTKRSGGEESGVEAPCSFVACSCAPQMLGLSQSIKVGSFVVVLSG